MYKWESELISAEPGQFCFHFITYQKKKRKKSELI